MSKLSITLLTTVLTLTACGGGGGGNSTEPSQLPEPPAPAPAAIEGSPITSVSPENNSVTFESSITMRGWITIRGAERYGVFVESGGTVIEAEFESESSGKWRAESVPVGDTNSTKIRIFARNAEGGESAGELFTLHHNTERKAPKGIMPGLKAGQFLLEFPGNEVRTLSSDGTELGRQPLPTQQAALLGRMLSWPATGEVLQFMQDDERNCYLLAHKLEQPAPKPRTLFELNIPAEFSASRCTNILQAFVAGDTLYVIDSSHERLIGLSTSGERLSEVSLPSPSPNPLSVRIFPNHSNDSLFVLATHGTLSGEPFDGWLSSQSLDPVTGLQELLYESEERHLDRRGLWGAVAMDDALYYTLDQRPFRLDLTTMTEEPVMYSGFTAIGPLAVAHGAGAVPDCESCYYALDHSGRVARVNAATLHSDFIVDTAPFVMPPIIFADQQLVEGKLQILEEHLHTLASFPDFQTGWYNSFDLSLESLTMTPWITWPSYHESFLFFGPSFGGFKTPLEIVSIPFAPDADQDRIVISDLTLAALTTRTTPPDSIPLEFDYSGLGKNFSHKLGLAGEYIVAKGEDSIYDFNISTLQTNRQLLFGESSTLFPDLNLEILARFPGSEGAVYVREKFQYNTIYEVDFVTRNLREVTGPNIGEGPMLEGNDHPTLGIVGAVNIRHWSFAGNVMFAQSNIGWWKVDLATGDRTLLFDGELPEGMPEDFDAADFYYFADTDTLLVTGAQGVYAVDLGTGVAAVKVLEYVEAQ